MANRSLEVTPSSLGRYDNKAKFIINLADLLGWSVRFGSTEHRMVVIRKGDRTFNVPSTNINARRVDSWLNQLVRGSDTVDLLLLEKTLVESPADLREMPNAAGTLLGIIAVVQGELVSRGKQIRRMEEQEERRRAKAEQQQAEQAQQPEPEPQPERDSSEQHGDDDGHDETPTPDESPSVADGLTCPECGFEAKSKQGLGAHRWSVHRVRGMSDDAVRRRVELGIENTPDVVIPTVPDDVSVPNDSEVVAETPWLAKRGETKSDGSGMVYEHPYIAERTHKDGTVDYICTICRQFTRDNGRAVAMHVGGAHKDREKFDKEQVKFKVDDYGPVVPRNFDGNVRRLASEITHALDSIEEWQTMEQQDLAHLVAERMIERRPDRPPVEPLTPEQVIARITGMVMGPQMANLHASLSSVRAELATAAQERDAAVEATQSLASELQQVRDNFAALRELIDGISS